MDVLIGDQRGAKDACDATGRMPTLRISDASGEEGDLLKFHVTLNPAPTSEQTYWYKTYRGTAGSRDYDDRNNARLTFRTGETSQIITVRTDDDDEAEDVEEFYIYVTDDKHKLPVHETPSDVVAKATGTIRDNDRSTIQRPRISSGSGVEGESITFTVTLDQAPTSPVTYYYATYQGTARTDVDDDYRGHDDQELTFRPGRSSVTIAVQTNDDDKPEEDETFYIYIADAASKLPDTGLPGSSLARATGTIRDNDELAAKPDISAVRNASADEGDVVTFTVNLTAPTTRPETYYYATYYGDPATAEKGDYAGAVDRAFTIASGRRSAQIAVRTYQDADSDDETFYVYVRREKSEIPDSVPGASKYRGTGAIRDDDESGAKPDISAVSNASADEGGVVTFLVTLAAATTRSETYYYATYYGGSATAERGDYVPAIDLPLTIASGRRSAWIRIRTNQDADSDDETFYLYVRRERSDLPDTTPSASKYRGTGTIRDDDKSAAKPDISSVSSPSADEGDVMTFTVTLAAATTRSETYYYATYYGGSATAERGDYEGADDRAFTIPSGRRNAQIRIRTNQDADSDDETFYLYVRRERRDLPDTTPSASKYRGTGTIRDDDKSAAKPDISSVSSPSADEGDVMTFTVTLAAATTRSETYYYATYYGGSATAERGDYEGADDRAFTIPSGRRNAQIRIRTNQDADSDDETFYLYVRRERRDLPDTTPSASKYRGTGTIRDDDKSAAKPDISSVSSPSADEGDVMTFTVTLAAATTRSETYYYATYYGGSATAERGDYEGADDRAFTIPSGRRNARVRIRTNQDADTDDETFYLYVRRERRDLPDTTPSASKYRGTGTIRDDDKSAAKPDISSVSSPSADEGDVMTFTVTLAAATTRSETYYYATYYGGSATAERGDYEGADDRAFTIPSGRRNAQIRIRTNQDADSDDETFYLYVRRERRDLPNNTPGASKYRGTGTIRDDDKSAALPDLVVSSASLSDSTVERGDRIRVRATVKNQGSGDAGSSRVRYDVVGGDGSVTKVGDDFVGSLASGRSSNESEYIDTDDLNPGAYGLRLTADYEEDVAESDESNNHRDLIFYVTAPALPDLIVSSASLGDTTVEQGDRVRINATVKNQGSGRAGRSRVAYYVGKGQTLTKLGDDSVSSLSSGESDDEYINADTDDLDPGTYFVLIQADYEKDVTESDETNNIYAKINFLLVITAP